MELFLRCIFILQQPCFVAVLGLLAVSLGGFVARCKSNACQGLVRHCLRNDGFDGVETDVYRGRTISRVDFIV